MDNNTPMTWLMYKSEQWVANCEDGSGLTITAPDIKTIMGAIKQIAGDEKFYKNDFKKANEFIRWMN